MVSVHSWLKDVDAQGGGREPPPAPRIPDSYLQKPLRQHPASRPQPPPPHLPNLPSSSYGSNRKRPALAAIDPPNRCLRRRLSTQITPGYAKWQSPRSPSEMTTRSVAKKSEDSMRNVGTVGSMDAVVTPRPGRVGRHATVGPATSAPTLHGANMPDWPPNYSPRDSDHIDRDGMDAPVSRSSVTESTGSKTRSRSPTKRMIDLRVAEKKAVSKMVTSLADVPEDMQKLYKEIRSLARVPRAVIPVGIEV